jgi:hypothetical protein
VLTFLASQQIRLVCDVGPPAVMVDPWHSMVTIGIGWEIMVKYHDRVNHVQDNTIVTVIHFYITRSWVRVSDLQSCLLGIG